MNNSQVIETLKEIYLGDPQVWRNLTVFPLFGNFSHSPNYITLSQAIEKERILVREISESGSVPQILLENVGDMCVLLVDGEELIGAKQNRILNLSILVPPRSRTVIPVSCVEAGRWSWAHSNFHGSENIAFSRLRMRKARSVSMSLNRKEGRLSDQSEVWETNRELFDDLDVHSRSQAMGDTFDNRREALGKYVCAAPAIDEQLGAIFAVNANVVGLDLFDHPWTLHAILPKLVRSYSLDALRGRSKISTPASRKAAKRFLEHLIKARAYRYRAIGEGDDFRLETEELLGGALVVNGRVVHLCAFANESQAGSPATGFSRAVARKKVWRKAA